MAEKQEIFIRNHREGASARKISRDLGLSRNLVHLLAAGRYYHGEKLHEQSEPFPREWQGLFVDVMT